MCSLDLLLGGEESNIQTNFEAAKIATEFGYSQEGRFFVTLWLIVPVDSEKKPLLPYRGITERLNRYFYFCGDEGGRQYLVSRWTFRDTDIPSEGREPQEVVSLLQEKLEEQIGEICQLLASLVYKNRKAVEALPKRRFFAIGNLIEAGEPMVGMDREGLVLFESLDGNPVEIKRL